MKDYPLLVLSLAARLTLMFCSMLLAASLMTPSGLHFQEPNRIVAVVEILIIGLSITWLMLEGMGFCDWLLNGGMR